LPISTDLKSIGTSLGGKSIVSDSNISRNQIKSQYDSETKSMVDLYDKYKNTRASEQASLGKEPFALDDNKNTIDFYMSHIKQTNPEEYNYMIQKQESLSKDKKAHELAGQTEDVQEDDLMIQKSHADLLQKALALKTRVMSGKYDLASNAIKDNYGDVIKNLNESTTKAQDAATKIQGIDDFLKNNYKFDENGQIMTTPANKKEVEDLLNKRNEFISEHNLQSENIKNIQGNEDFNNALSLLDETQKTYDSLEKTYTDIKNKNPDAFKGLPEYRKQLLNEQRKQFSKDLKEAATGGTLAIPESIGRGVTGIISSLSFMPKSLSPNSDYGWTDKLYDVVKSNVDDFDAENNPLPTGYDKPVYENGEWNLKYLPGKIAGTLTEMAPIIAITAATEGATAGMLARAGASGELGTSLGSFAGEYVAVANDFYDEAKASGMSEKEAMSFSRSAATTQAVLGTLSPDIKLARRNAFKEGLEEYTKQIAKGVSVKDAVKESAKGFAEKLIKEVPQENLQTWAEIQDKNDMYEKMGLNEKIQNSVKKDLIETTILSSLVTLGLGANGVSTPSRMQKESLFMAASQPEEIMKAAQNMLVADKISQQEFNDITMKVAKANFALSKMDKSLSAEQKSKALIPLMEKLDLKEEAAKLDDSQKELLDEKIAKKDAEIKGIVSSPSDEEIENANEAEAFFNRIKEQHTKDNAAKVEIPASENKMQKEGLFEVDDSQKSQPIELSTQPENAIDKPGDIVEESTNNTKDTEAKIAEIEKAIKDNKLNFFNEKIDNNTYWKNQDALERDLANLQNPAAHKAETLTTEEVATKETPTIEDVKPLEPEVKTEEVVAPVAEKTTPKETSAKKETPSQKTATQISAEQNMIDEEDVLEDEIPSSIKNAKTEEDKAKAESIRKSTSTKMTLDKEAFKLINEETYKGKSKTELKDLVEKKYIGTLERAYKNKVDGIISGPEYTKYRNELNDIVTGKLSEYSEKKVKGGGTEGESLRKGELKAQVSALGEKVKEKLLGQGFKNVALSSAIPINPKMIEDLVNLTVKGVHLGIDLGYGVREATDRALKAIKAHPKYKQVINSGMLEKDFAKSVNAEFSKAKSTYTPPVVVEEKTPEKSVESTSSEKNTESTSDSLVSENKTTENTEVKTPSGNSDNSELESGKVGTRKITERLEDNKKYESILNAMSEDDKTYKKITLENVANYVSDKIKEFESANKFDDLVNDLMNGNVSQFPEITLPYFYFKIADKLNSAAELEQNEFVKSQLLDKAAELLANQGKKGTTTGQTMAVFSMIAQEMPTSRAGLKSFIGKQMNNVSEASMSEKNKAERDAAIKELVDLQVKEKLSEIAEGTKSKEQVSKIKTKLSSLKIDLKDC